MAEDGTTALEIAASTQPHIILLELGLRNDSGIGVLAMLRATAPESPVILLTRLGDPEQHLRAVQLGARGVVRKDQTTATLRAAITQVHAGAAALDPALTAQLLNSQQRRPKARDTEAEKLATLTAREHSIIALICDGLPNNDIGERLQISDITVRHHLSAIFKELGVTSRLELALYAFRHGLAKLPG